MAELKPPIQCESCEYFALQPAGWTCSVDIYIKVDGEIISPPGKRPENCPELSKQQAIDAWNKRS